MYKMIHKKVEAILRAAALFLAIITAVYAAPPAETSARIVVQKTTRASSQAAIAAINSHGASLKHEIPQLGVFVITVPPQAVQGVTRALTNTGLFTYAEVDGTARGGAVPNDPMFSSQWHLGTINAVAAWDITTGKAGVPIAMVDSGVNASHADLQGRLIPGWSFLLSSSDTSDVLGHGTATAGTAGAASNNGIGVTGVSWQNPIMPLVVLNSSDYANYSDIANAIIYAADHGVRVINVSIGGSSASSTLQSAVTYAWNKGSVVFASAMNNATSTPYYPAACDYAIAVSATEPGDTLASFSNYGSWIDLSAPGDNILTTDRGGAYSTWYGTSFSSPIAAATAALALSVNPSLTAQGLVNLLEQNSDDIGAPGYDTSFGWGRINAYKAVLAAGTTVSADTIPPSVAISTPASGSTVSGSMQIAGTATDNVGVVKTELWIDGQLNSTCASVGFSCVWNASAYAGGSHTVTIKSYDAAGNMGSASETVIVGTASVADTQPPTVQIVNPLSGATVSGLATVSVSASDNVGVTQVSIYIDGVQKASFTSAPYTYTWNTKRSPSGSHTISATAWDAAGNTASTSITVKR